MWDSNHYNIEFQIDVWTKFRKHLIPVTADEEDFSPRALGKLCHLNKKCVFLCFSFQTEKENKHMQ